MTQPRRRITPAVYVSDSLPMGVSDAMGPDLPLFADIVGLRWHPNGVSEHDQFAISVTQGRGIIINNAFRLNPFNKHCLGGWIQGWPHNDLPELSFRTESGRVWQINIMGILDVRFWLAVSHNRFIKVELPAMVTTDCPASGALRLSSSQMWIGSNTGRIMPDSRNAGYFICRDDDGCIWDIHDP